MILICQEEYIPQVLLSSSPSPPTPSRDDPPLGFSDFFCRFIHGHIGHIGWQFSEHIHNMSVDWSNESIMCPEINLKVFNPISVRVDLEISVLDMSGKGVETFTNILYKFTDVFFFWSSTLPEQRMPRPLGNPNLQPTEWDGPSMATKTYRR